MIPSSFGMTFSLNLEAKELQLSAAWGQYVKDVSEYLVSEKDRKPTASMDATDEAASIG